MTEIRSATITNLASNTEIPTPSVEYKSTVVSLLKRSSEKNLPSIINIACIVLFSKKRSTAHSPILTLIPLKPNPR